MPAWRRRDLVNHVNGELQIDDGQPINGVRAVDSGLGAPRLG